MAEPRLARGHDPRGATAARTARCSTPACSWRRPRAGLAPIGGYATTLIVAGATQRFGTEEQKDEILGGIADGAVEAIAMTEPEAGSDVGSLTTAAERVNGGFVINGQKVFCSNAHISDHVLVVCRTTKGESKHEGLTMIWVPHGRRRDGGQADRHDGRPRDQLPLLHRLRGAGRGACSARSTSGWMQLMAGPQRRAPDPRRDDARHRPARLRRRPRLRQGAASSSAARSAPSRPSSTGSPTWRPTSRRPG